MNEFYTSFRDTMTEDVNDSSLVRQAAILTLKRITAAKKTLCGLHVTDNGNAALSVSESTDTELTVVYYCYDHTWQWTISKTEILS